MLSAKRSIVRVRLAIRGSWRLPREADIQEQSLSTTITARANDGKKKNSVMYVGLHHNHNSISYTSSMSGYFSPVAVGNLRRVNCPCCRGLEPHVLLCPDSLTVVVNKGIALATTDGFPHVGFHDAVSEGYG